MSSQWYPEPQLDASEISLWLRPTLYPLQCTDAWEKAEPLRPPGGMDVLPAASTYCRQRNWLPLRWELKRVLLLRPLPF